MWSRFGLSFLTIPRLISSVVRAIVGSAERPMQACMSGIVGFENVRLGLGYLHRQGWWRRWFFVVWRVQEWSIPVVDRIAPHPSSDLSSLDSWISDSATWARISTHCQSRLFHLSKTLFDGGLVREWFRDGTKVRD